MDLFKESNDVKPIIYDDITGNAEMKILASSKKLGVDKLAFVEKNKFLTTYYDTYDHLLTKSGILLSKTYENGEFVLKIEKLSFLPNISKLRKNNTFIHKIQPKDEPKHHAFYIVNGITSLFATKFTIDIENIIKKVVPIYVLKTENTVYKAFSSNGFKCLISFEDILYLNKINKRKRRNKEVLVTLISSDRFVNDFQKFVLALEKYCKDILKKNFTRFEYAEEITKTPVKIKKEAKNKKNKNKIKIEDKIEG